VTANKALLAEHGREIFALAKEYDVPIFYEAAVAGGIPIIQSLRDAFVGNRIESIEAILNGTSNYILSRMQEGGLDYGAALAEAQELGYAEANPALDINGGDAAHKATILAALAYGFWIEPQGRRVAGIEQVRAADAVFAKHLGYVIKLLATVRATADDAIEVTIAPTLIAEKSLLASVGGAFNAIAVKGDLVGEALFYGQGAGGKATASSVIGDLVEAALTLESSRRHIGFTPHSLYSKSHPPAEIRSCYYLRLSVEDRPGVLGTVARILGEEGVGIASVIQPKSTDAQETALVFMTHEAPYGTIATALEKIALLPCVKSRPVLFNVNGSTGALT
jgi:homoserine dehydrogenase